jgi:hypothetical protein
LKSVEKLLVLQLMGVFTQNIKIMDINNIFIQKYFLLSTLILFVYTLIRILYNKKDNFRKKILNIIIILLLPVLGCVIVLIFDVLKREK